MQDAPIYKLAAYALLAVAVLTCWFVPRIPIGDTHPLPVRTFPRIIGAWKAVEDRPLDPGLKADLPTATIVERIYRRPGGHDVDLLLLTASREADFHDPTVCLPSQGWETIGNSTIYRDDNLMHDLQAKLNRDTINIVYWEIGDFASKRAKSPIMKDLYRIRSHFVMNEEGACLMVRVITDDSEAGRQEGMRFIDAIQPMIDRLQSSGTKVSQSHAPDFAKSNLVPSGLGASDNEGYRQEAVSDR